MEITFPANESVAARRLGPDENTVLGVVGFILAMCSKREYFYRNLRELQKYLLLRRSILRVYRNIHLRPWAEPEEILS